MPQRSNHPQAISRRALVAGTALAAATARAGIAVAGTPAPVEPGTFAARIGALLAAMPVEAGTVTPRLYYADLAAQLESVGIARPEAGEAITDLPPGFSEATLALPLASRAYEVGLDPRWLDTFGFSPYAAGQAMVATHAGDAISMFRGGFDPDAVRRALAASGYIEVERERGRYLSFGDEIAPETTVGQLGLGAMNQAIVGDDLLIFAARETSVEAVLDVLAGAAEALAAADRIGDLIPLFSPDVVGMIPVDPGAVATAGMVASPVATPVGSGTPLEILGFGVRAGSRAAPLALGGEGTPVATPVGEAAVPARVEARLRYGDAETAAREAEAIPSRWRDGESTITGEPFGELMELVDAAVVPDDPRAVAVDLVADTPNRWSQMVLFGDLAPFLPVMG